MTDHVERLTAALADRYRIDRELGAGGMATVYLAEDIKHHRSVAVKVLSPELAATIGTERFLKEIEVTANLQHPRILQLYDSGASDSFLYYVMPYVAGESLRDKLNREKQLGVVEAVQIAQAVAAALDYAHRHGVIHRDIKPENILIHDSEVLVADFGIALAVTAAGGTRLTETGLSLGTPSYMSPEQAAGDQVVSARSDVYALGCVMYEMLTGEPPHTGPTPQAVVAAVMTEEPRRVTVRRKNVPGHIELAVHKALEKVPADRFDSTIRFARALATNNGSPVASGDQALGIGPRLAKGWFSRNRVVAVGAALLVAVFWVGSRLFVGGAGPTITSLAVLPLENQTGDAAQEHIVDNVADAIRHALSQIAALRVTSRTSAGVFKNSDKTIPEIARELNVDALVVGSVFQVNDQVSVNVQLVRAEPEQNLGSWNPQRPVGDLMAMHREVAREIARAIEVTVTPAEEQRLTASRSVDPTAQDEYLTGLYYLNRSKINQDAQVFRAARPFLQQAVVIDSNYAEAWGSLGEWHNFAASSDRHSPAARDSLFELAREYLHKARDLDSTVAQVWRDLAFIMYRYDWNWEDAAQLNQRALELGSDGFAVSAHISAVRGRIDEAIAHYKLAVLRDPLSLIWRAQLAGMYTCDRQFDLAIETINDVLELDAGVWSAHYQLALVRHRQGAHQQAVAHMERMVELRDSIPIPAAMKDLAYSYALAGRHDEARAILRELGESAYAPQVHLVLGDEDRALDQLEESVANRSISLFMRCWMEYEQLKTYPRFRALLEEMNYPM